MFTSKEESDFFLSHINENHIVLEWGSGDSTVEIAKRAKKVISIEHQEEWFKKVCPTLPINAELHLKKPNLPYVEGGHDGTYDQFKDYCDFPVSLEKFDIIFIDGHARVDCAKMAIKLSHDNTLIFIHDFFRKEYQPILELLDKVSSEDSMFMFKIKKL